MSKIFSYFSLLLLFMMADMLTCEAAELNLKVFSKENLHVIQLIENGKLDALKLYVKNGGNINFVEENGATVLLWAMNENRESDVIELLKLGADPKMSSTDYSRPLCLAPQFESMVFLKLFLEAGEDPNYWCRDDNLLMLAIAKRKMCYFCLKMVLYPQQKIGSSLMPP